MRFERGQEIPAIIAAGEALGSNLMTNPKIDEFLGRKPGFTDRVMNSTGAGIFERYWNNKGEGVSVLASAALNEALGMAGLEPKNISALWLATVSPDLQAVSTASIVQDLTGIPNSVFGSVNADACPGWILAAQRAATSLTSPLGVGGYHAVIGAEVISPYLNPKDPTTSILFGDAAGATIFTNVTPDEGAPTSMGFSSGLDGRFAKNLGIESGGSRLAPSHETIDKGQNYISMDGGIIFQQATQRLPQMLAEALHNADDFPIEEVDRFVFHQANRKIIEVAAEAAGIPIEKCLLTVHEMGNTSAASIPTAITRGIRRGEIKRNNVIAVASFGAGLAYSAAVLPMVGLPKYQH